MAWGLALLWLLKATQALLGMRRVPDLNELDLSTLPTLSDGAAPHLTVIVPACNEEESIESTLDSLLRQQGIRLQIIAVDDRSTDSTGVRMEALQARLPGDRVHTLEVIRNRELPPGWLGKPHAVNLGVARAAAPWILLTDADMKFAPQCLARALRLAEMRRAGHFVLLPTLLCPHWAERAALAVFQVLAQWSLRLWKVEDREARDFLGVGGFNMIRTQTLAAIGGIEAVRLEVVEDVSIGWLVKHHGFQSIVAVGPGQTSIRWFNGASGLVANLEKNGFAAFRFNLPAVLITVCALGVQVSLPIAALFSRLVRDNGSGCHVSGRRHRLSRQCQSQSNLARVCASLRAGGRPAVLEFPALHLVDAFSWRSLLARHVLSAVAIKTRHGPLAILVTDPTWPVSSPDPANS